MSSDAGDDHRSTLVLLRDQLEAHFTELRAIRDVVAPSTPIFALEHGLSDADLELLRSAIADAVRRRELKREWWLPFAVYAAEVGYEFAGDEYWQTFGARTPGWGALGDPAHQYVRRCFHLFRDRFGGAVPTGPWADWFTIICWPITHAVLPTDLQRHLARLLFDFRRLLTADLLSNPDDFGLRLAAYAWRGSSRFEAFAQNTRLLGQVAAALLTGSDEDESPFLLRATLSRIVTDLSKEQEARWWLADARRIAHRVRTGGFRAGPVRSVWMQRPRPEFAAATDPVLSVRETEDGWSLYVDLPDFAPLTDRMPHIGEELARRRPVIEGSTRRLATGYLSYPHQQLRLSTWPSPTAPLVRLEDGSETANRLLRDQCMISRGPRWLFRLRGRTFGTEVRGRFVRPGRSYLLVSETPVASSPMATAVRMATSDAYGCLLTVPDELDSAALESLTKLGVSAAMDVEVRPAGAVPSMWDGEGTAEWLDGERPLITIRSNRNVDRCLVDLDGEVSVSRWPTGATETLLRLSNLAVGHHRLQVSLHTDDADAPVAEGTLDLRIRSPHLRPSTGTTREGLRMVATPANPALGEIWDGQATLQVIGPPGTPVRISLALTDRRGQVLLTRQMDEVLPIDAAKWSNSVSAQFRSSDDSVVFDRYEQAEGCAITAEAPGLGAVRLECERAFVPLRWAFGREKKAACAYLVNNTDEPRADILVYGFEAPAEGQPVEVEAGQKFHLQRGGLVVAVARDLRSAMILPPERLEGLADLRVSPRLEQPSKSVGDLRRVIDIADLWSTAALPADLMAAARRSDVLRSLTELVVEVVAGRRWAIAERSDQPGDEKHLRGLRGAIGDVAYQQLLASAIIDRLPELGTASVDGRVREFAVLLDQRARQVGIDKVDVDFAEFLLRLATEPATLKVRQPAEVDGRLQRVLDAPVLLRAARLVVLGTALRSESGSIYPGWVWE